MTTTNKLPGIVTQTQIQERPQQRVVDHMLVPVLNEKSSLYVIYQVFRVTAIIIVVLTLIFVLVTAVRQIPLLSGADTVSDRLRELIAGGSAAAGKDVARAAIVSIAAVGVGTAVVVGGRSLDFGSGNGIFKSSVTAPTGQGGWYTSDNGSISEQNPYSLYLYRLTQIRNNYTQGGTLDFPKFQLYANIDVPRPSVVERLVADTEGTQEILEQLKHLIEKLNPSPDTTALTLIINRIDSLLQKQAECNCGDYLKQIKESIDGIKNVLGQDSAPQNSPSSNPKASSPPPANPKTASSPAANPTASPSPSPNSTASPSPSSPTASSTISSLPSSSQTGTILASLKNIGDALVRIEAELSTATADNRLRQRSDGRNLPTRATQLFRQEYYLITDKSYVDLKGMLETKPANKEIIDRLKMMKGEAPRNEGDFLTLLRHGLDKANLKPWEKVILIYARLPR